MKKLEINPSCIIPSLIISWILGILFVQFVMKMNITTASTPSAVMYALGLCFLIGLVVFVDILGVIVIIYAIIEILIRLDIIETNPVGTAVSYLNILIVT